MKKLLLAAALFTGFSASAVAETEHTVEPLGISVYTGSLTYHFDRTNDRNETNATLIARKDNVILGYFKNSYYKDTLMAGNVYAIEGGDWEVAATVGAVIGYYQNQSILPCIDNTCALVAPMVTYTGWKVKPTVIYGGTFVTLAVRYDF